MCLEVFCDGAPLSTQPDNKDFFHYFILLLASIFQLPVSTILPVFMKEKDGELYISVT